MMQPAKQQGVKLTIPADQAYAPVATLALSGLGMIAGLDVDLLGDLRTAAGECMDCLLHQAGRPEVIELAAWVENGRLCMQFAGLERRCVQASDPLGLDITRGVLETLMPEVTLHSDEKGVHGIQCSMPV